MSEKLIPANQDTEDDIHVTLVIWGTNIGSWPITPTDVGYKSGSNFTSSLTTGIPSASTEEEPARWRFCCSLLSLICFLQVKMKLSYFSNRYQGWCNLGGGLGVYVCVLFGVWSCGFISLAISLQLKIATLTGSIPILFGLQIISTIY